MARRQKSSVGNGSTGAASQQLQHHPQPDGLLDLDCVLQHPPLSHSLVGIARLLCTSKATTAAVHQHAAGHLQKLHLNLKDLEHTEQVAAWLVKHVQLTQGVRTLFLQPPQLLSTLGLEEAVAETEEVLAAAVVQMAPPHLASLELSRCHSLALVNMLPHLSTSLQHLSMELDPCSYGFIPTAFQLAHFSCLTELVLQGRGGRLRFKCQLPASLQRLTIRGGSHLPLMRLPKLRSLDITASCWQGHHELAAIGASLTNLTNFGLVTRSTSCFSKDVTWLGKSLQCTVAALQVLPLQSLRALHAATPIRGSMDVFASPRLLGSLTHLTRLELFETHKYWDHLADNWGRRFEARCLAASLQRLTRLQELRLEGSLNGDDDDHDEAAAELMRVLSSVLQLRQLHLDLDDVGPAVVQLKAAQQLTSLYCKSRSATVEQMQQLAAGWVLKFDCGGESSSDDDD